MGTMNEHTDYKRGVVDSIFELGKLYQEHEDMNPDDEALRGINEARNELTAYLLELD